MEAYGARLGARKPVVCGAVGKWAAKHEAFNVDSIYTSFGKTHSSRSGVENGSEHSFYSTHVFEFVSCLGISCFGFSSAYSERIEMAGRALPSLSKRAVAPLSRAVDATVGTTYTLSLRVKALNNPTQAKLYLLSPWDFVEQKEGMVPTKWKTYTMSVTPDQLGRGNNLLMRIDQEGAGTLLIDDIKLTAQGE